MASAPCRRSIARTVPMPRPVSTLSIEDVVQTIALVADLEALCREGMLIEFADERDVRRFCPQREEFFQ